MKRSYLWCEVTFDLEKRWIYG